MTNKYIEEKIKKFEEKFSFSFNIGVVPDDITKENIIEFIKQALEECQKRTREEIVEKVQEHLTEMEEYKQDPDYIEGVKASLEIIKN